MALARSAPHLVRAAALLPRWAASESEFYDLPEPDVLEWNPDAPPPEGALAWHGALTGQAITAERMNRAQDWLTLGALAQQMAGHWRDGEVWVQTAPLAREALLERAAAAALRAMRLAEGKVPLRAAALAFARASADAGDSASALRGLHALAKEPALADDATLRATLEALETGAQAAPGPALESGQAMARENWALVCANDLSCAASLGTPAFVVRLSRAAGPGAALHISFILAGRDGSGTLWPQRLPGEPPFAPDVWLRMGEATLTGEPASETSGALPLRSHPGLHEGWAFHEVQPLALDPVLTALLSAPDLRLSFAQEGAPLVVPLAGLHEVLGWMDEIQGRSGAQSALVHRGPAPAKTVPPAPLLPRVPAPFEPEPGRAIAPRPDGDTLALWRKLCPDARDEMALAPVNTRTAARAEIWLLPCSRGADGRPLFAALHRLGGQVGALLDGFDPGKGLPPEPLLLAFPALGPAPLENPGAKRPLALSAQLAPECPGQSLWVWTGRDFALLHATATANCAASLLPPDTFVAVLEELKQ